MLVFEQYRATHKVTKREVRHTLQTMFGEQACLYTSLVCFSHHSFVFHGRGWPSSFDTNLGIRKGLSIKAPRSNTSCCCLAPAMIDSPFTSELRKKTAQVLQSSEAIRAELLGASSKNKQRPRSTSNCSPQ